MEIDEAEHLHLGTAPSKALEQAARLRTLLIPSSTPSPTTSPSRLFPASHGVAAAAQKFQELSIVSAFCLDLSFYRYLLSLLLLFFHISSLKAPYQRGHT